MIYTYLTGSLYKSSKKNSGESVQIIAGNDKYLTLVKISGINFESGRNSRNKCRLGIKFAGISAVNDNVPATGGLYAPAAAQPGGGNKS